MEHYAIGDVHGEYETLKKLVGRLPKKTKLFFVGDLIDRGADSAKVVDFVRNGNHGCVLGNHEDMMIEQAKIMETECENYEVDSLWAVNGGLDTLLSYGIIELLDENSFRYTRDRTCINKFIDDAKWMKSLPLMIGVEREDGSTVVISHSSMLKEWRAYFYGVEKSGKDYEVLKNYIVWNRNNCKITNSLGATGYDVVNVFGHTPQSTVDTRNECINIDTGCTYDREGLGKLTALNLKTMELAIERRSS